MFRGQIRSWLMDMDGVLVREERPIPGAERFLEDQRPGRSALVIGEAGPTTALRQAGYTLTERDPDYVHLPSRIVDSVADLLGDLG